MEYPDNKPRRKRVQREEIGGQMLTDSIIGEIDRLDAIGEQAGRTAEKYRQIFDDLKGYELRVDTAALDAKEKEFATALEKQVKQIRAATRTVRAAPMADDCRAVPCFRRRVLLPRHPPLEGKILSTGTTIQPIAAGNAEVDG